LATNKYFQNFTAESEQNLVEDLLVESIQIFGVDTYYLPRKLNNLDVLLGEDPSSSFERAYQIEMYFGRPEGFENNSAMIDSLGYFLPKEAKFLVSRKRFMEETTTGPLTTSWDSSLNSWNTASGAWDLSSSFEVRPLEGDIIWLPLTKEAFEIKYVNPEATFYQLGKLYVWELTVEKFVYSQENITTGIAEIDSITDAVKQTSDAVMPADQLADNTNVHTNATPEIDKTEVDPFSQGSY
jgi:neck protein